MRNALFLSLCLPCLLYAQVRSEIIGDVRVQVLSPTLVRLESKGPKGFDDRVTFRIVNRNWPGARTYRLEKGGMVQIGSGDWTVSVPANAKSLEGIAIANVEGKEIFKWSKGLSGRERIPGPDKTPEAWAFADAPRLFPPTFGATPAPQGSSFPDTSGWDTGNDAPDVYVFLPDGDPALLRSDWIRLTGPAPIPPLFTFGFWDSKYYVYSEESALATIDMFRRRRIPLDLIVIDTDWRIGASHGYGADTRFFPDMGRFLSRAHEKNVKVMFNDHPEPQAATALDPKEMEYRWDGLAGLLKQGLDVWWYDRNWSTHLHEPMPGLHKEVWGMRVFQDMTQAAAPGRRPLIMANVDGIDNGYLNEASDVSSHRFAVQWTGDTRATWDFLKKGVTNMVYGGATGASPYMNEDLGGHMGHPDAELYVRFLQYGCLSPVTRIHCTKGDEREPWLYSREVESIVSDYIALRYRLQPVIYEAARNTFETGEPLLRRCDFDYPKHKDAARPDQYLMGTNLLIAPITASTQTHAVPDGALHVRGEYFSNMTLEGTPSLVRDDKAIDFVWGGSSPDLALPKDGFSARWTGKIGPIPAGAGYKLSVLGDDGVRLWIDDKLVVDKWLAQDSVITEANLALQPGQTYSIRLEYYEDGGDAACKLIWKALDAPKLSDREVWIPPGGWRDVWTGAQYNGPRTITAYAGLAQMPMFVKDGAIIPLAPPMQFSWERPWSPLALEVFAPASGQDNAELYEDDGTSNDYLAGRFRKTQLSVSANPSSGIVKVDIGSARGSFTGAPAERSWVIRLRMPANWICSGSPLSVEVDGRNFYDWKILARAPKGMPLMGSGNAPDGDVLELRLPSGPATTHHTVTVKYAN